MPYFANVQHTNRWMNQLCRHVQLESHWPLRLDITETKHIDLLIMDEENPLKTKDIFKAIYRVKGHF